MVVELSRKYFTFQDDAEKRGAIVDVLLGDARIVMERQLERQEPQSFDVLVVDAFSSDAVPLHLLTRECFQLYGAHLHENGILAVHASNRHLDLRRAVKAIADHFGYISILIQVGPDPSQQCLESSGSVWVLLTRNREFANCSDIRRASETWPQNMRAVLLSDDSNSLFPLLR